MSTKVDPLDTTDKWVTIWTKWVLPIAFLIFGNAWVIIQLMPYPQVGWHYEFGVVIALHTCIFALASALFLIVDAWTDVRHPHLGESIIGGILAVFGLFLALLCLL